MEGRKSGGPRRPFRPMPLPAVKGQPQVVPVPDKAPPIQGGLQGRRSLLHLRPGGEDAVELAAPAVCLGHLFRGPTTRTPFSGMRMQTSSPRPKTRRFR